MKIVLLRATLKVHPNMTAHGKKTMKARFNRDVARFNSVFKKFGGSIEVKINKPKRKK